jgi:hypothetical protein
VSKHRASSNELVLLSGLVRFVALQSGSWQWPFLHACQA